MKSLSRCSVSLNIRYLRRVCLRIIWSKNNFVDVTRYNMLMKKQTRENKAIDLSVLSPCFTSRYLQIKRANHCVKSFQQRSFFWSVFSRIRTEYGEIWSIRTRKNSLFGHFSRSEFCCRYVEENKKRTNIVAKY